MAPWSPALPIPFFLPKLRSTKGLPGILNGRLEKKGENEEQEVGCGGTGVICRSVYPTIANIKCVYIYVYLLWFESECPFKASCGHWVGGAFQKWLSLRFAISSLSRVDWLCECYTCPGRVAGIQYKGGKQDALSYFALVAFGICCSHHEWLPLCHVTLPCS